MLRKTKAYRYLLYKSYFDTGLGLTSYAKYILALIGMYSIKENISFNYVFILGIIYVFICFILGYLWYRMKLIHVANEVANDFNPFQIEVRKKLNGKKFK